MICRSCRTTMLSRFSQPITRAASATTRQLPLIRNQIRAYSSDNNASVAATPSPSAPRQPTVGDLSTPSAISSATPGVSQPLSTPEGVHVDVNPAESTKPTAVREPSSCVAGTKLNGLNYFKNKPEVFAKEDSEYPDWLWNLLGSSSDSKTKKGGVDPSTLNKKQRKRYEKKLAARTGPLTAQVPAHHHAHDITPASYNRDGSPVDAMADATGGFEQRSEIIKTARDARRKSIKESNFLRGL
ncbi:unnamed protein product [Penicillium salamii]|uniref:Large ribosomal subunit protein mL54 n=1 Tax=Penicillium salamii TaxID=1612424 RepID=A0A9W4NHE0_9EURO|nr:unnamed protein product [Penicillium salamii]CAG7981065.1 unnamed protein product [Penicillium salamii]CAG8077864.1 unnamed protein product [Penicillium salamii]CAG8081446.1 unnamed protein product [Penicillium salamii]CAG8238723.1 unnamed protein product [Penicillium salamii]